MKLACIFVALAFILNGAVSQNAPLPGFRPPSVPLITMDPYMNIWSMAENLYDDWPKYWPGTIKAFSGIIRVDGDVYRFLGGNSDEVDLETVVQQSVTVWPTRTIYQFQDPDGRIGLTVQFTTPALPKQWDISSRPITYITYTVSSADGGPHNVQLYYDNTAEIAVDSVDQVVTWNRFQVDTGDAVANVLQIGTESQDYFDRPGDGVGIDWGYAYVAVEDEASASTVISGSVSARTTFINDGSLPPADDPNVPRPAEDDWPVLAIAWDFAVDSGASVTKYITFAYDDVNSIEYFGHPFQPYWRRPALGATVETLLESAITDYPGLLQQCEQFDTQLVQDLEAVGGAEYATLAALAYRQTMAATKVVWNDQLETPWIFLKEISSNGDLSTVDVLAPASPFFVYLDPEYLEYILLPLLAYSNNETGNPEYNYALAWAPHHLGTYPVANIHSDQQENMPMEETGNILMMLAAITQKLGLESTDLWYPKYWPLLQSWADYLVSTLPDPEDQLCTDDFEGPEPHNANLAIKGIVGLGAFSELCRILGKDSDRDYYLGQATGFAAQWIDLANDGDHYRLQFDQAGTWSQKYNLMYERALGLSIFPEDVVPTELAYYLNSQLNQYGIPLDNRATFTKLDWTAWVAAMTPDTDQQTQIFHALYTWANNAPQFTPLTDWYDTVSGNRNGFTARPVVGGIYALMIV